MGGFLGCSGLGGGAAVWNFSGVQGTKRPAVFSRRGDGIYDVFLLPALCTVFSSGVDVSGSCQVGHYGEKGTNSSHPSYNGSNPT